MKALKGASPVPGPTMMMGVAGLAGSRKSGFLLMNTGMRWPTWGQEQDSTGGRGGVEEGRWGQGAEHQLQAGSVLRVGGSTTSNGQAQGGCRCRPFPRCAATPAACMQTTAVPPSLHPPAACRGPASPVSGQPGRSSTRPPSLHPATHSALWPRWPAHPAAAPAGCC